MQFNKLRWSVSLGTVLSHITNKHAHGDTLINSWTFILGELFSSWLRLKRRDAKPENKSIASLSSTTKLWSCWTNNPQHPAVQLNWGGEEEKPCPNGLAAAAAAAIIEMMLITVDRCCCCCCFWWRWQYIILLTTTGLLFTAAADDDVRFLWDTLTVPQVKSCAETGGGGRGGGGGVGGGLERRVFVQKISLLLHHDYDYDDDEQWIVFIVPAV